MHAQWLDEEERRGLGKGRVAALTGTLAWDTFESSGDQEQERATLSKIFARNAPSSMVVFPNTERGINFVAFVEGLLVPYCIPTYIVCVVCMKYHHNSGSGQMLHGRVKVSWKLATVVDAFATKCRILLVTLLNFDIGF